MEQYKIFNALPILLRHEMQLLVFVHKLCFSHSSELPMIFKDDFVE